METRDLEFLIDYVGKHTGIQLDSTKGYLLSSRLGTVLRTHELSSLEELCKELRGVRAPRLLPDIVDAMTTNETSFFRDGLPFEQLAKEVLPRIIAARASQKKIRLWSAACSSGQEAVTLAIVLHESFPELKSWDVKILASDVSAGMVERCRSATYSENEIGRGMPADLKARYFDPVDRGWQAKPMIRSWMSVRQVNLIHPLPVMESQDLVLLRNVLIYFDEPTRERIFTGIQRLLASDGFLLLGTAEKPRSDAYSRAFGPHANVFQKAS